MGRGDRERVGGGEMREIIWFFPFLAAVFGIAFIITGNYRWIALAILNMQIAIFIKLCEINEKQPSNTDSKLF